MSKPETVTILEGIGRALDAHIRPPIALRPLSFYSDRLTGMVRLLPPRHGNEYLGCYSRALIDIACTVQAYPMMYTSAK